LIATPFAFQADNSYDVGRMLQAMDGGPARAMRIDCAVGCTPRLMSLDAEAAGTLELLPRPQVKESESLSSFEV
jgi:hypothetical protein